MQAPVRCDCGALVTLTREVEERSDGVAVGLLTCGNGHQWVDIRPLGERRRHGVHAGGEAAGRGGAHLGAARADV